MRGLCIGIAIILIILTGNFIMMGYDRLSSYDNPTNDNGILADFYDQFPQYRRSGRNAYVGGDAYNYIINAGQATAFYVLAIGCFLSSMILFVLSHLIGVKKRQTLHSREMLAVIKEIRENTRDIFVETE